MLTILITKFFRANERRRQQLLVHLLVVPLQSCQVYPRLCELCLLHPLAHVPVDKGPLGVHQVKLVVQPRPRLRAALL